MVFPSHIVAAFTEIDPIVISDEDEEPILINDVVTPNLSGTSHLSKVKENKAANKVTSRIIAQEKKRIKQREDTINKCIAPLERSCSISSHLSPPKRNIKENAASKISKKNEEKITASSAKLCQSKEQLVIDPSSPLREASEEGEIFSDEGSSNKEMEIQLSKNRSESFPLSKTSDINKIPTKVIDTFCSTATENEDEAINSKLFERIDELAGKATDLRDSDFVSWKDFENEVQFENSPILRQKNEEMHQRRSSNQFSRLSLSPVSPEEDPSNVFHKKKKKKHKHKRKVCDKTSEVENNSDKYGEGKTKQKNKCGDIETHNDKVKSPIKQKKSSKKHKETRKHRLLSVSDDQEEFNTINAAQPDSPKNSEVKLFHRRDSTRKENRPNKENVNSDPVTVVLLDSDEDSPPSMVSKSGKHFVISTSPLNSPSTYPQATNSIPTSTSSPIRSALTFSVSPAASCSSNISKVQKKKEEASTSAPELHDLNNMGLQELNDIYFKLCQTTGIQLEELLSDLVTKSKTDIDRISPQNQNQVLKQPDFETNISPNSHNNNNDLASEEGNLNRYELQQQQLQNYQEHQQKLHQHKLQNQIEQERLHQQQLLQLQYPVPVPYTYQNSLRSGLNLNDPRIVQRLKQIKDSPIHNINIRESASILMNCHTSRPQTRNNPIVEVTSKTATTYGEHKRLRELEKEKALQRQKVVRCTEVTNNNRETSNHAIEKPTISNTSRAKRKNSSGSDSGKKTPESNEKQTEDEEEITKTSFSINSKSRQRIESSSSDDDVDSHTPSKENLTSGRMTPYKRDKVIGILLSAVGEPKERADQILESLNLSKSDRSSSVQTGSVSRSSFKSGRNSSRHSTDSTKIDAKSPKSKNVSEEMTQNNSKIISINNSKDECQELSKKVNESEFYTEKKKKRGRPRSICRKDIKGIQTSTNTTSTPKKRGNRELSNLSCTLLEYKEMFEKNSLPTVNGKRHCSILTGAMIQQQAYLSDSISQESEENLVFKNKSDTNNDSDFLDSSQQKIKAAPIQRRRQTCSALPRKTLTGKKTFKPSLKVVIRRLSENGVFGVKGIEDNSSEDTTEFDVEEQCRATIDHDPFGPQLKVKLRKLPFTETGKPLKLTDDRLRKYSCDPVPNSSQQEPVKPKNPNADVANRTKKSSISPETPMLVAYNSKPVDIESKSAPKSPRYLNTDISMTLFSRKICVICNKRSFDLTSHYVVQHKTESYISRMTLSQIETLEANITIAVPYRKQYKVSCAFCQDELEDHFVNFHSHYSSHTGEYGFKCDVCDIVRPYREDIRSHQLRSSRCRNGKIRRNYLYSPDLTVIYLYACKLCNFVQLNEANVQKHQRDHHDFTFDKPELVKKFIIAAVDSGEVVNEVLSGNPEEVNSKEEHFYADNQQVMQEQEFVHECPLDIKDVLLNLEYQEGQNRGILSIEKDQYTPENQFAQETHLVPQRSHLPDSVQETKQETLTTCSLKDANIDKLHNAATAVSSPEALLAQLHDSPPDNIMTVIHAGKTASCQEKHQPYVEAEDRKPNVNDIKIEQIDVSQVETKQHQYKTLMTYRQVNSESNYFGLYKCTVDKCWFSTNVAEKFIQHTSFHESKKRSIFLNCAYCRVRNSCAETLVRHVRSRHSMSRYQCSECSYRSITPGNVCIHRGIYHKDSTSDKCIYACVGRVRSMDEKLIAMKKKMDDNISNLQCPDCPSTFYALSSIKLHIQKVHPILFNKLDTSIFNEYACIYCKEESNSKCIMQVHLATEHPDEMDYFVERRLKNDAYEDAIKNLNLISISKFISPADIHTVDFEEIPNVNSQFNPIPEDGDTVLQMLFEDKSLSMTSKSADNIAITPTSVQMVTKEEERILERIKPLLELVTSYVESQSRDIYFCFHCVTSFYSREKIGEHFTLSHKDCQSFTEKAIPFGTKSYYILKKKNPPVLNWAPVLEDFAETMRINWIEKLQQSTNFEWREGLTLSCLDEIEVPEYISIGQPRYRCLVRSCPYVGLDENALDNHLNQHTLPRSYKCSHCAINLTEPSWDSIKNHKMLHKNELHICCVCKFVHHTHSGITTHIDKFHNSRDVPVITMWRDETNYKISLAIILPAGKNTFTTTVACFCCGKEKKSNTKFIRHLRTEHNITLCRRCELCKKILLTQIEAETHSAEHGLQICKLKYDVLATYLYNLAIKSMSPFAIEIRQSKEKRPHENDEASITKRTRVDGESPITIKEEITIKTECEEDILDSAESLAIPSGAIKCVNIDQLVVKEPERTNYTQETEKRPEHGTIYIKSTAELQMEQPAPTIINTFPNQHQAGLLASKINTACLNSRTNRQTTPTYPIGLIQSSSTVQYSPPVFQPQQLITPDQFIMNVPLPNNQGTAVISRAPPSYTIPSTLVPQVHQSHTPSGFNRIVHYAQQNAHQSVSTTMVHSVRADYAQQNEQPTGSNTVLPSNINKSQVHYSVQNVQPTTSTTTVSPDLQTLRPGTNHSDASFLEHNVQSSLNLDGSQDTIIRPYAPIVPEIVPICGNCKKECSDFSHLKSHFELVHAPKQARFLFRLARRIQCVFCPYRGSLGSLSAHYATFHPNEPRLCRSIIDSNRCGVCHGILNFHSSSDSSGNATCDCPTRQRVLADCLDLKTLNAVQNFGKKFYAYLCELCKKTFHYQWECSQHILAVHPRVDIIPRQWLIKNILYVCNSCEKTATTIKEVIEHIRNSHLTGTVNETFADRMAHYNKIGVIYPMGLIVFISELRNTGSFDLESFKRDVQCVEAQYRSGC